MTDPIVITHAKRTAVGSFGGALAGVPAHELGAAVIKDLLSASGLAADAVSDVLLGQVLTAGCGQNPARQAALAAGLPETVTAATINAVCGSGLKTVQLAMQALLAGGAEIIIAGGQENMSLAPYLLPALRRGQHMGNGVAIDSMVHDGLTDAFNDYHMGITAENLAKKYGISRQMQDEFALASQQKAARAQNAGKFADEITPVSIPQRRGEPLIADSDEYIKHDASAEALARLRPAFDPEGTVTAGNASGINDGAAAVLMMKKSTAEKHGLPILATVKASAMAGCAPEIMGIGPVGAVRKTLQKAGWEIGDLELIEANEAFAAQAIAVNQELGWNTDIINVNGGAIAIGHPIGASGCRILVTLLHEMQRRDAKKALAALCIGGGMGIAAAVERTS